MAIKTQDPQKASTAYQHDLHQPNRRFSQQNKPVSFPLPDDSRDAIDPFSAEAS